MADHLKLSISIFISYKLGESGEKERSWKRKGKDLLSVCHVPGTVTHIILYNYDINFMVVSSNTIL